MKLPERKVLPHGIPHWVEDGAEYFITICGDPRGKNQFCKDDVADGIHATLNFYHSRGDFWMHLVLLMPDHLHAIISFSRDPGMSKSIAEFKKYTARNLKVTWQRDFFDHRLRNDESYIEKARYIRNNPVRAELCSHPDEWKYVWENRPS